MPNPVTDALEWTLAKAVAGLEGITGDGGAGAPDRAFTSMEDPAWEECCKGGGQLTVSVASLVPTEDFPVPAPLVTCSSTFALTVRVELVRCAPQPQGRSGMVDAGTLSAAALALADDGWAMYREVICSLGSSKEYDGNVGLWAPSGEQGGCHGVAFLATLHLVRTGRPAG